jgi:hypothetical protein
MLVMGSAAMISFLRFIDYGRSMSLTALSFRSGNLLDLHGIAATSG